MSTPVLTRRFVATYHQPLADFQRQLQEAAEGMEEPYVALTSYERYGDQEVEIEISGRAADPDSASQEQPPAA